MNSTISEIVSSSTARKVVGSLGVIGAAAAVAGMGTFGTFTDSTTPVTTTISSGTVDIDVTGPAVTVPVNEINFVPGDSVTRTLNLVNKGSAPLGALSLNTSATAPSILTDNRTNGLQLSLQSCSVAWTGNTCPGTPRTLIPAGGAVGNVVLDNLAAMNPGGTDYLAFTVSLPLSAGNEFQGKTASLGLTFTGSQRTGTAR